MPQRETRKEETKETPAAKPKRKRWVIILVLVMLLLVGTGGGVYYFVFATGDDDQETPRFKGRTTIQKMTLDPIVVNLADAGLRRYLRTKITLEYDNSKLTAELENKTYRVRDTIISVLRGKRTEDLQQEDALKLELLAAINAQLEGGQVRGLYFEEFIIQ